MHSPVPGAQPQGRLAWDHPKGAGGSCADSSCCPWCSPPPSHPPSAPFCPGRFWFRLYWFPLKVLYATCHSSLQSIPHIPFYFFFNALLFTLTLMNIYWFLVSSALSAGSLTWPLLLLPPVCPDKQRG